MTLKTLVNIVGAVAFLAAGLIAFDVPAYADAPKILKQVAPRYPRAAQRRKIEGKVVLNVTIKADGTVEDVEVEEADPPKVFDKAAIKAVEKWKFDPREEDLQDVKIPMMFKL